jgi:F0F1-type ATP synthase assembly protein I
MASPEPSPSKKSSQYNTYLKYSGLAFQLFASIGVLGWLGYLLDKRFNSLPLFTLLFGLLAFGGMMYQVYRSINK